MFVAEGGCIYVCQTFYSQQFRRAGRLVFAARADALAGVASRGKHYPSLVWKLYDPSGAELASLDSSRPASGPSAALVSGAGAVYGEGALEKRLCNLRQAPFRLRSFLALPASVADDLLLSSMWVSALYILVMTAAAAALETVTASRVAKPLDAIAKSVGRVRDGDFSVKLPDYEFTELREISEAFNAMTQAIDRLIKEDYEKQILVREAELKLALSQMNPHFMFNVLLNLSLRARMNGDESVGKQLSVFAKLLQATLYRNGEDKVTIAQELEYVGYYLSLQHGRFYERFSYGIEVESEELLSFAMPKLCLQSLVENAVVHGCEPKPDASHLTVRVRQEKGAIILEVEDTGPGFEGSDGEIGLPLPEERRKPQTHAHNQFGLNNVHKIIKLTYGDGYGARVFSTQGKGTRAIVRIPFDGSINGRTRKGDSNDQSDPGGR
jgi:sensor histidine kinase YesM